MATITPHQAMVVAMVAAAVADVGTVVAAADCKVIRDIHPAMGMMAGEASITAITVGAEAGLLRKDTTGVTILLWAPGEPEDHLI